MWRYCPSLDSRRKIPMQPLKELLRTHSNAGVKHCRRTAGAEHQPGRAEGEPPCPGPAQPRDSAKSCWCGRPTSVNVEAEDAGLLRKQGPCKVHPQALRSRGQRAARKQAWGSSMFCRNTGTGKDGSEERGSETQPYCPLPKSSLSPQAE